MTLEVTVSAAKSTDVTYKTRAGYLAAQSPWLVDLTSLVWHMNCWFCCRVSAVQSMVAGSITRGGGSRYTLLMRPNKAETAVQCFRIRRIFWSWQFNSQYNYSIYKKGEKYYFQLGLKYFCLFFCLFLHHVMYTCALRNTHTHTHTHIYIYIYIYVEKLITR